MSKPTKETARAEETYQPSTPDWFKAEEVKSPPSKLEEIMGDDIDNYRKCLKVLVWACTAIVGVAVVICLIFLAVRGGVYTYKALFPADPHAVQPIKNAPEAFAQALYAEERAKHDGGFLSTNPMPRWEDADEATRNLFRLKAISMTQEGSK